eukprot:m.106213 g.106213  ORF g.106213 m.106213 type:complete len:280 (-) comp16889_c1_seq1:104-943(-)
MNNIVDSYNSRSTLPRSANSKHGKPNTFGTVIEGTYMGYENCYFQPGNQTELCIGLVKKQIERKKANKEKGGRATPMVVTVHTSGLSFVLGESGAAKFEVPVKDISSMSLCPKGKSGRLKIIAAMCRASSRRHGLKKSVHELDMICHIFRPNTTEGLWAFYAAFESMLKNRNVDDPYLQVATDTKGTEDVRYTKTAETPALMKHFEPDTVQQLQKSYEQRGNTNGGVGGSTDDVESDIEVDFSDEEEEDDVQECEPTNVKRLHGVVTLCADENTEDAEC